MQKQDSQEKATGSLRMLHPQPQKQPWLPKLFPLLNSRAKITINYPGTHGELPELCAQRSLKVSGPSLGCLQLAGKGLGHGTDSNASSWS